MPSLQPYLLKTSFGKPFSQYISLLQERKQTHRSVIHFFVLALVVVTGLCVMLIADLLLQYNFVMLIADLLSQYNLKGSVR